MYPNCSHDDGIALKYRRNGNISRPVNSIVTAFECLHSVFVATVRDGWIFKWISSFSCNKYALYHIFFGQKYAHLVNHAVMASYECNSSTKLHSVVHKKNPN